MCVPCSTGPTCFACGAVTGGSGAGARAGTLLADGRARCARCAGGAVDSRADLATIVPPVRELLWSYGIRLPNRVRVQLTPLEELAGCQGDTTWVQHAGTARVLGLRVAVGLPATLFGAVLAHEMGHAWLAGCPARRTQAEDEGLCELLASWWLRHRGGRLASHLLSSMGQDPDPLYGDGYRDAVRRAGGLRPEAVVRRVASTGRL
jgi:hypothetical protein